MALAPLAAIDRLTLGYVAIALGFTLVRGPQTFPAALLLPLGLALTAATAVFVAPRARRAGPLGAFLGEVYPLLLTVAFYTHIGVVNRATGVAHDALVQRWEQALFGAQPSLAWIRSLPSPAWSTLMHAAYLSYYVILTAAPLGLWFTGRRQAARTTVFATMLSFFACYTIFLAFPVAGPRYTFPLPENAAMATPVARLTHLLVRGGSAWGTAFPSSHVAAAFVAAVSAWRASRALGALLIPAAALLALSTVYGQFHYAVDAIAGATLAAVVLAVIRPAARQA